MESESKRKPGRRGWWKVFLIVMPLALAFGVVLLLAGLVARELLLARRAIKDQKAEEQAVVEPLLALGRSAPAEAQSSAILERPPAGGTELDAAGFSQPLIGDDFHWQPGNSLPEVIRWPEALKPARDEINARFAAFLRDVAAFEREKDQMAPEAAEKRLREMDRFFEKQIMDEIVRIWPMKDGEETLAAWCGEEKIYKLLKVYGNWSRLSGIALRERLGAFRMAADDGLGALKDLQLDWHFNQDKPQLWIFRHQAQYYREHKQAIYHRVIYDYWRSGGKGYLRILDVALPRMYEDFIDRIRRARED